MLYLHSLAKYCLVATALGCLSVGGLSLSNASYVSEAVGENQTSHRGSGRLVTQVPTNTADTEYLYRGTGRIERQQSLSVSSHRGSGRVHDQPNKEAMISYRGTGRIALANPEIV